MLVACVLVDGQRRAGCQSSINSNISIKLIMTLLKMKITSNIRLNYSRLHSPYICLLSLILIICLPSGKAWPQSGLPFIDSLETRQKTAQLMSAPYGTDEPLENPDIPLDISKELLKSVEEEPSAIEQKVSETLNAITLEEKIQQQAIQAKLQQFGYDQFSEVPTTYAPLTDIPVPHSYHIGAGDTIIVQLYGKLNVEYTLVVTRDGRLLVPEIGPLQVAGLSFGEIRDKIVNVFTERVIGVKTAVTMGKLRSIQVFVLGDVIRPGAYTISGLSTLMNALMVSGGIKRTGTLRNIFLKRDGLIISTFDLYDVFLHGNTHGDTELDHGDVIFVGPVGSTVGIGGEVKRPAIYELKHEETVEDIIAMAGGLMPTAALKESNIERIYNGESHTLIDLDLSQPTGLQKPVKEGDLIRIFPVASTMDDVILLSGHVRRPGGYQITNGMRISSLIPSTMDLLPGVDMEVALLKREIRSKRRIRVRYVNLSSAINNPGSSDDILLDPRDELIVFSLDQKRADTVHEVVKDLEAKTSSGLRPMIIEISGHVRYQGVFPLAENSRLLDVLELCGGIQPGTDLNYSLITREVLPDRKIKILTLDIATALQHPLSIDNPVIHPKDKIYIFDFDSDRASMIKKDIDQLKRETGYGSFTPLATVTGWIEHPGSFPLETTMHISDLIKAGGGLKEIGYGISAELTRYQLINKELREVEHLHVNLNSIMMGDTSDDITLQPYDHLKLNRKPEWREEIMVKLGGEIVFPGEYPIRNGETLSQVIKRAGGLTESAYPFGAVFVREKVRMQQQEALDRLRDELDDLLVKLHLSPSFNNSDKMPAGEGKYNVIRVIKQLKKAKAAGRMIIDLEGAMNGKEESDIVLKHGDKLYIPAMYNEVTVMGEVYFPSSHLFQKKQKIKKYINMSGGATVLAKRKHAYVVQANGEVNTTRPGRFRFGLAKNIHVTPGATIYVPINVDRINKLEKTQSWSKIIFQMAISAAGLSTFDIL